MGSRERGRHVRLIADDGDGRNGQGADLGHARECFYPVDAGVPQRDFGDITIDDVNRSDLREQARQPRTEQRIVGQEGDLDRLGNRLDRELRVTRHDGSPIRDKLRTLNVRVNPDCPAR